MSTRRNYLSQTELAEYADIIIEDVDEANDRISQAEEIIDQYVGSQDSFLDADDNSFGLVESASTNTLVDNSIYSRLNKAYDDYFERCEVEILKGTGAGQVRTITSSSKASASITLQDNWDTTPDATSYYVIRQLAKFPRECDVSFYTPTKKYFKEIPVMVRRAVAAQVQYMIEKGDDFFAGDDIFKQSMSIGKYSHTLNTGVVGIERIIAPKAKLYLRGITNKGARLISDNPTCL